MILGERVIEVSRDNKTNVLQRLKRIEGQIKGVQRMVEEEAPCLEILTQIAAARGPWPKWAKPFSVPFPRPVCAKH